MSALAFVRGWEDAGRRGVGAGGPDAEARPAQPRLFALPGGVVEDAAAEEVVAARLTAVAAPAAAPKPAPAVAAVRTLDEVLTGAWSSVSAGATAGRPRCSRPPPGPRGGGGRAVGRRLPRRRPPRREARA